MAPGLDDELAKRLGEDAEAVRRWTQGVRASLAYAHWEDRGNTTARVFAVYAKRGRFTGKLIMKYVPKGYKETDEPGRHLEAWESSPAPFRDKHLVRQQWDSEPAPDGGWVMFQEVAGHSLHRTRSLATLIDQLLRRDAGGHAPAAVADAAAVMVVAALDAWNSDGVTPHRPTATAYLRDLLGDRLGYGKPLRQWATERGLLAGSEPEPDLTPLPVGDHPNPFALVLGRDPAAHRGVYTRHGRAHGDLHPGNVLFDEDLTRFWFIDLSRFGSARPLAFDPAYLLLTITAQLLPLLTSEHMRADLATLLLATSRSERSRLRLSWLPQWARLVIDAIHDAGEAWADESSVSDEWRAEMLLSLVASGLIMAGRCPLRDAGGEWFLRLAAAAGDRYSRLGSAAHEPVAPTAMAPATPATRRGIRASLSAPDPLPYAVGRVRLLEALRGLHAGRPGGLVVLHGPPGSGKTQLAVNYVAEHRAEYSGTAWFSAESPALLAEQFACLAGELGVPVGGEVEAIRPLVAAAMLERGRWLLVFDGAPNAVDIRPFLVRGTHVDVLVTSRSPHWTQLGARIEVAGFDREESVALLTALLGEPPGNAELAEALGDLPAAVAQAAHFISTAPMTVSQFRALIATRTMATMAQDAVDDYGAPLATVWTLALGRLATDSAAGAELVTLAAFFGPAPVPSDVLAAAIANHLGRPVDGLELAGIAKPATESGLISASRQAVHCYPVLQAFIREQVGASADRYREAVRDALVTHAPVDPRDPDCWRRFHLLLPHILAADLAGTDRPAARTLLLHAVAYLVAIGDLDASLVLVEEALCRCRDRFGADAEPTVEAMTYLAHVHFQRRDYAEAQRLDQEVLERNRARFGPEDPRTLVSARNAAASGIAGGPFDRVAGAGAGPPSEPIVQRQRELFGVDHPETLRSALNLAHELRASGNRWRARETATDTHRRMVGTLGPRHLDTLLCAHGLALDLRDCGTYEAARTLNEEIYAARLELLGADHPDTAQSAVSLATDLRRAGDAGRARELDAAAHETLARIRGADDPLTLLAVHGLAADHERLGELDQALRLAEDTYQRRRNRLGPDDLATLRSGHLLARLLDAQGHSELVAPLRADLRRRRITLRK